MPFLVLSAAVLVIVIENASRKARVMRTAGRHRAPLPSWSSALLARKPAFDYEYEYRCAEHEHEHEHEHENWTPPPS